jgi:hypothetical protein
MHKLIVLIRCTSGLDFSESAAVDLATGRIVSAAALAQVISQIAVMGVKHRFSPAPPRNASRTSTI